jgi:MFS family permease
VDTRRLPRTVIALGIVSFFTDFSSEMIYPLLPVFLSTVLGAGAIALGVIEGVAESTAALLKVVSGIWTDRASRRKPFILAGYGLSSVVRPLIGLARVWPVVLLFRFMDRVGKGVRTSPRDALIADVTAQEVRGTAYGFHRSMDHAGAVVGPLAAAGLLALAGVSLRHVFLLAAVPAAVVIAILFFAVREPAAQPRAAAQPLALWSQWRGLGRDFKVLLLALLVFTLGNSTDMFLLLRLSGAGVPAEWVAMLWALHHVVKMVATYWGGHLSDAWGRRRPVILGWAVYAAVYAAFATVHHTAGLVAVFLAYGVYFGLTEPAEKAWVADLVPRELRGTAFGYYHGTIGLAALPASALFGLLWYAFGASVAFLTGAALAAGACAILFLIRAPGPSGTRHGEVPAKSA